MTLNQTSMLNKEAAEVFDIRNANFRFKSASKLGKELPQVENQKRLNDNCLFR
jgi:hypothetical protein